MPGGRVPRTSNRNVPLLDASGRRFVNEAQNYNEVTRARTPAVDKLTGSRVWTFRVSDLDPDLAGRVQVVIRPESVARPATGRSRRPAVESPAGDPG